MRGFLSGLIWGTVASVGLLWLVSQLGGMIQLLTVPPANVTSQPPVAVAPVGDESGSAPSVPAEQAAPATDPSRLTKGPDDSTPEVPPQAETAPATSPALVKEIPAPIAAAPGPDTGAAAPGEAAAPVPAGSAPALAQPGDERLPAVADTPNQPVVTAQATTIEQTPQPRTAEGTDLTAEAPPPEQEAGAGPATPAAEAPPVVDFTEPQVVTLPEPGPTQPAEETVVAEPVDVTESTDVAPGTAETETGPAQPAPDLRSDRLPTIGGVAPETPETPETAAEEAQDAVEAPAGPAIEAFAAKFENPEGRPLMAVLLLVDPDDTAAPAPLPFPVTYVIDASKPGATEQMRRFRDAGAEVVALAPLPERAAPRDVEVAFESYLSAVPEAVAVMDTRAAVFQSGRLVATQVAEILAATGHGLITYARGLNSATQVAAGIGVPAGLVFRLFDSDGQDRAAIKRYLDQAAFRAGQQGGVIMVGHLRPETVAALTEWALGNRAETVALAPVSAVLPRN